MVKHVTVVIYHCTILTLPSVLCQKGYENWEKNIKIMFLYIVASPWHAFNQSYFKFVPVAVSFNEAMKLCRAEKGADLASFSSEEEQSYIHKTFLLNNPQGESYSDTVIQSY